MKFDDHFPAVTATLKARLARNVAKAGEQLRDGIKDAISTQGPPRSEPFTPPHRDTGELYETYWTDTAVAADEIAARVGSDLDRDVYLEFGTETMDARPHARATLIAMWDDLVHTVFA